AAHVQDPAVDFGMQRLDPAVHHLWKPGELGNVSHTHAGVAQKLGRAAGGNQLHFQGRQLLGEVNKSCLVSDAQDSTLNFGHGLFPRRGWKTLRNKVTRLAEQTFIAVAIKSRRESLSLTIMALVALAICAARPGDIPCGTCRRWLRGWRD